MSDTSLWSSKLKQSTHDTGTHTSNIHKTPELFTPKRRPPSDWPEIPAHIRQRMLEDFARGESTLDENTDHRGDL